MNSVRTDLAVECATPEHLSPGITRKKRGQVFSVTEIEIAKDEHGAAIGKPAGRYVTLEAKALTKACAHYAAMAEELAEELRQFLPKHGTILVAGLGNHGITPDALGPRVAEKILATRHLKSALTEEEQEALPKFRPVCVLAAGVLGQTGIESAELLHAICRQVKPSALVAVDALACASLSRLGTTIQLCDSGIAPGSGVANHRVELSPKTFGIPVIALGVPTVVDLHTVIREFSPSDSPGKAPNMMVTPREIDRLIDHAGDLLACSLNMALHPGMTFSQAEGL